MLLEHDDYVRDGWKLGQIFWKDPCIIFEGFTTHSSFLKHFISIGYYKITNDICSILLKADLVEGLESKENIFINIPKANIEKIIQLKPIKKEK